MMLVFKGILMSFFMFSIIPMPRCWDDKATPFVMTSFPFVGMVIGLMWFALSLLLELLKLPLQLSASILLLFPLFLSGFIHIDGYMDTYDAIGSRAELSKKREILKDSHVGAFAVIALGVYFMLGFSAMYSLLERGTTLIAFAFIPILSRSLVSVLLLNIKLISDKGFGATFRQNTKPIQTIIVVYFGIGSIVFAYMVGGFSVLFPLICLLIGGVISAKYVIKQLDGISGDLCGFVLTVSELCAIITMAIIGGQK